MKEIERGNIKTKVHIEPCPFCAIQINQVYKFHEKCYAVSCENCGCDIGNSSSLHGAIRRWNRRRLVEYEKQEFYKEFLSLTCIKCNESSNCEFAFDLYNMNGECLKEK